MSERVILEMPGRPEVSGGDMYCTNCGEKLAEGAVFCGSCGCRVGAGSPAADGQTSFAGQIPLADGSRVASGAEGQAPSAADGRTPYAGQMPEAEACRYQDVRPSAQADGAPWQSQAQADPQFAAVNGGASQLQPDQSYTAVNDERPRRSSLTAFLMERRQVGKAMVPTFAIILAMLIAAAGTAYALVKAYEVFVEPAIEQKSESSSGTSATQGGKKQSAAEKKEEAKTENKKAHAAYDKIVDLYKAYGEYCEEAGPGGWTEEELRERLPQYKDYSYIGYYWYLKDVDPEHNQAFYLMKDIDGDGVDELFVSGKYNGSSGGKPFLVNFYYFADGKAKSIFDSIGDGIATSTLSKGGFLIMGEGQGIELGEGKQLILDTHQDRYSATYCFDYADGKLSLTDALQLNMDELSNIETSCNVTTVENGGKAEVKTSDWESAVAERNDFYDKHPTSTDNDKLLASNDWTLIG